MPHESQIITKRGSWKRLLATNTTAAASAIPAPWLDDRTSPSGNIKTPGTQSGAGTTWGIIPVTGSVLKLMVFGSGSANQAGSIVIEGLTSVQSPGDASKTVWTPEPLGTFTATLGTMAGVTGGIVTATDLFADTLALGAYYTAGYNIVSPETNRGAVLELNHGGPEFIAIGFAKGAATSLNVLWRNN